MKELKKVNRTRTDTRLKYICKNLMNNIQEHSNGKSAFILLFMTGIKIYDMDEEVAEVKTWTELSGIRQYYEFFKQHQGEFEAITN